MEATESGLVQNSNDLSLAELMHPRPRGGEASGKKKVSSAQDETRAFSRC